MWCCDFLDDEACSIIDQEAQIDDDKKESPELRQLRLLVVLDELVELDARRTWECCTLGAHCPGSHSRGTGAPSDVVGLGAPN